MKPLDFYKLVRADMAKELGLDLNNATLQERLRLDLLTSIRLEIDSMQASQLQGKTADINKLLTASEALSKLINAAKESPDYSTAAQNDAKAKFLALIERHAAAQKFVDDEEKARVKAEIDALRADNERLRKQLPAPPPLPNPLPENVTRLTPEEKATRGPPAPAEQFHRAEPRAPYLKSGQGAEPWRSYVTPDGGIVP